MARTDEQRARQFARAFLRTLLEMAGEEKLPAIGEDLRKLAELGEGEGGAFFASPIFDVGEKNGVLDAVLASHRIDPAVGRLFRLLIAEREVDLVPLIASQYEEVLREHRSEARAILRSAFPLTAAERERISRALGKATGKKVLLDVAVDRELIGGVVAEVGGTVFDASIVGYLQRLREEF